MGKLQAEKKQGAPREMPSIRVADSRRLRTEEEVPSKDARAPSRVPGQVVRGGVRGRKGTGGYDLRRRHVRSGGDLVAGDGHDGVFEPVDDAAKGRVAWATSTRGQRR